MHVELLDDKIISFEESLGYCFRDKKLLAEALTHPTYAYEIPFEDIAGNQRLEFLGDSILGMIVAEYLFGQYPNYAEGELTRRRSLLVNRKHLALKAAQMNFSQYLLLGKGESKMRGQENFTNLAGAIEAVIGAIYLDGGLEDARQFITRKVINQETDS